MTQASEDLMARVKAYAAEHNGLYAPVPHPDFAGFRTNNRDDRFDIMRPHLEGRSGTLVDLGSHWGYFAHRFEDMGFQVTAVEHSKEHLYFLREIRDLCGKRFEIYEQSFATMKEPVYDVVLALNIFHHYLKMESRFKQLESFLERLKTKMIIYQGHKPGETQMQEAWRYMEADEFARHIAAKAGLRNVVKIGSTSGRDIFKLSND